jgi:hypothetical protein
VPREPLRAQLGRNAKPAKMLHRARIGVVALGVLRRIELVVDQHGRDLVPGKLNRRREAHRPAANYEHECFRIHGRGFSAWTNIYPRAARRRARNSPPWRSPS